MILNILPGKSSQNCSYICQKNGITFLISRVSVQQIQAVMLGNHPGSNSHGMCGTPIPWMGHQLGQCFCCQGRCSCRSSQPAALQQPLENRAPCFLLVHLGCYNRTPETGGLISTGIYSSQFCRLEVPDQSANMVG